MLSRKERARQFLPFDALDGFRKKLAEKENEKVERIELFDEQKYEISEKINLIDEGEKIKITYYRDGKYKKENLIVLKVDRINKKLITSSGTIKFMDIFEI